MALRCYFESDDGIVLRSADTFADEHEAAIWASSVLSAPEGHELEDPHGVRVSAEHADTGAGVQIEPDESERRPRSTCDLATRPRTLQAEPGSLGHRRR